VVEGQTRQPEALAGKFPIGSSNLPRHTILMGTLEGCPNPPAMVRGEQSSPAPHADPYALVVERQTRVAQNHAAARPWEFESLRAHTSTAKPTWWNGRPARLKPGCSQEREGSSPSVGTILMGTLEGCPNLPAIVRGKQSSPAPHADPSQGK
jgi:hypothetical protein